MPQRTVTPTAQGEIRRLHAQGLSFKRIARQTGYSDHAVARVVNSEAQATLSDHARAEIRRLYAAGTWIQRDLAELYSVSKQTVALIVAGITPSRAGAISIQHPTLGPKAPADHTPLPVVRLHERVWMLRPGRAPRLWWPSVPEQCGTCGGAVYLEPPLHEPGRVLCRSCSREVVEVRL